MCSRRSFLEFEGRSVGSSVSQRCHPDVFRGPVLCCWRLSLHIAGCPLSAREAHRHSDLPPYTRTRFQCSLEGGLTCGRRKRQSWQLPCALGKQEAQTERQHVQGHDLRTDDLWFRDPASCTLGHMPRAPQTYPGGHSMAEPRGAVCLTGLEKLRHRETNRPHCDQQGSQC